MSNKPNLNAAISAGDTLNKDQQESLLEMLTYRCNGKTKTRIASRLALSLALWPKNVRFERVQLEPTSASYITGQSYYEEIAVLRSLILKF